MNNGWSLFHYSSDGYKNIPQSYLFLAVEYCVDSVEIFHTLLWNVVIFQFVVKRFSVYTEQCCSFRFVVSCLF